MREEQKLAADICLLLSQRKASIRDGNVALITVTLTSLMQDGLKKEPALKMLGKMWDQLEPNFAAWRQELNGAAPTKN